MDDDINDEQRDGAVTKTVSIQAHHITKVAAELLVDFS